MDQHSSSKLMITSVMLTMQKHWPTEILRNYLSKQKAKIESVDRKEIKKKKKT